MTDVSVEVRNRLHATASVRPEVQKLDNKEKILKSIKVNTASCLDQLL